MRERIYWIALHLLLILGIILLMLPLYLALVAATHTAIAMQHSPIPFLPGHEFLNNLKQSLFEPLSVFGGVSAIVLLLNSFVMALCIAAGKIVLSIFSAFGIVYFDFRLKKTVFALIFLTLMLPVEVRIVPTFQVTSYLGLLNSYTGLTLPLIASATATFLFRQFFMTIPHTLLEASRVDGAGPMRFFFDIVLPLSKTNIAALFIIMFIYGWNQYLWPLVATTRSDMYTIVMGIHSLANVADQVPQWERIMTIALCAMAPPVLVIISMQRLFVRGLIDVEK